MLPAETVILAGPTGAGKTTLALALASRLGGEIVGADAFQIYAGLPVLTAQPSPAERARIPHHLVGVVDPAEAFDAGRYLRAAVPVIRDIARRGRVPIVTGGTGFYFKALLGGLQELPAGDPELRREFSRLDLRELAERLGRLDPEAVRTVALANRRRVERALEIVILTGKPLSASRTAKSGHGVLRALLLTRSREDLHARIAANVEAMFAKGVEAEVAALPEESIGPTASGTLGLREVRDLLEGRIGRRDAADRISAATRRYAKRQLTWFRNQHDFPVLRLGDSSDARLSGKTDEGVEEALRLISAPR